MPLDTQTFGITRYWLSAALRLLTSDADIFTNARLRDARKAFLAGKNQLAAIKNWLVNAGVIELGRGRADVTEMGRLMAAKDDRAERAWTWWLFHLHLCANSESYPYSTFFTAIDADGNGWMTEDDVLDRLANRLQELQVAVEVATIKTYFQGVEQSYRLGGPLHDLQLIEYRVVDHDRRDRLRRCAACPADIVVAYGTMLFQQAFFPDSTTVEARLLLDRGLARSLGINEQKFREALGRIHHNPRLSEFVQYRGAVNLDSVQFMKIGPPALKDIRSQGYASEDVRWP